MGSDFLAGTSVSGWGCKLRDELDAWENERLALLKEIIDDAPQAELQQRQEVGVRRAILESLLEMGIDCFPEDLDPSDPRYRPPFERSVPDSPELNTALAAAVGSAGTPLVDESRRQRPVFKRPGQRSLHDKTCCIFGYLVYRFIIITTLLNGPYKILRQKT